VHALVFLDALFREFGVTDSRATEQQHPQIASRLTHSLVASKVTLPERIFLLEQPSMAIACEICGKKPSFGNVISHAHNVRRRRWNPNLRRVKTVIKGTSKHIRVCTACIRAGKVKKAA
jgi:large subunit ribosomal protein L28